MKKLLFVVAEVSYFKSHRLNLALYAKEQGFEVALASQCKRNFRKDKLILESLGIKVFHIPFDRTGLNPIKDLLTLFKLQKLYKEYQPDIIHHVALKPIIYGTIAGHFRKIPKIVNAISGFGVIFSTTTVLRSILKYPIKGILTWAFRRSNVIVQNEIDKKEVNTWTQKQSEVFLIPGAGVDTSIFTPQKKLQKKPIITFVGRLLWSKGLRELVHASKILIQKGISFTLNIVGDPDLHNPDHIPASWIKKHEKKGLIHFLGHREDIKDLYQQSRIAILPSYREGLPKSLIEACACGLPIITTDVPGCMDVVENGANGILVPARNPKLLASAMEKLLGDMAECEQYGKNSRKKAESIFSESLIFKAHKDVWE